MVRGRPRDHAGRGVTVPAYTTSTSDDLAYLLGHAEVTAVICSGRALAKRLLPAVAQSPTVRLIIYLDPDTDADAPTPALTWSQALGCGAAAAAVDHGSSLQGDDLACFIYTSGTGGRPKGVMLTHRNILANLRAPGLLERIDLGDDVFLSFLPLSHAYEHTAGRVPPDRDGRADLLCGGCGDALGQPYRGAAHHPHLRASAL